jgi:3-oxoacyl-[acyl-carrier protein] reductase
MSTPHFVPSTGGNFAGRSYLVIGAAGGIGSALCRTLVASGARVLLAGRTEATLAPLAAELGQPFHVADAGSFEQVDAAFDAGIAAFGRLDGAVNLAGSIVLKAAHQTTQADLESVLKLNLVSAFATVRSAARTMRGNVGSGEPVPSVVLMSSTAARVGLVNHEAISAAKAGVIGLCQSAAATYAGIVRINTVAPGLTRTPMARPLLSSELAEKASVAMHPAGRIGEIADILPALLWLLDPASSFVTGQVIGIDGGLSTVRQRAKV